MEFTLIYSGPLKGGQRQKDDKHALRKEFHLQLKRLWNQPPLSDGEAGFEFKDKTIVIGPFLFLPLIRKELFLFAELNIILFRAQPPGEIIHTGGDIDNRLKTLFDGLRKPTNEQELPGGAFPEEDETPFYCLLEDDSLIVSVNVTTRQDLRLSPNSDEVLALIKVIPKKSRNTWNNADF
jgi:hypothetical protein